VDLNQKNSLCEIIKNQTLEDVMKQEQDTKMLEIKIKEISDSRQLLNSGITKMET
jgi:hypothetical protein